MNARPSRLRPVLAACVFALLALFVLGTRMLPDGTLGHAQTWLHAAQDYGRDFWLSFVLIQTLIVLSGIIPASLVGVAAGAIYGLGEGFALATCSTLIGATLSFYLGRFLFRPWISGLLQRHPRLRRLDQAVARDGWRTVFLLRVTPIMPFAATGYALGVTSVGLRAYLLGTLAALPALFGYVLLGRFADAGMAAWTSGASVWHWAMIGVGIAATAALTLRIGMLARRSGFLSATTATP